MRSRFTLGELFRVKHGYAFPGEYFDTEGQFILLTPGNFHESGGFRDLGEKQKHFSGEVSEAFVLNQDDLIVAMTEQAPGLLGSSAWISESGKFLHNQRLGRVVDLKTNLLDKRYLYYLFNTVGVRHQIDASASGTKVRHTAPDRIGRVAVELPPLRTQQKITDVLCAYDDLIENNRRRMALLEESARLLYREWFVRLRFPGHEHTAIVNGLPEGWERQELAWVCEGNNGIQTGPFGSQLHQSDYSETGIPAVMPKDLASLRVDSQEVARIPESVADALGRHRMVVGDTVYGRRGDIGRRAFIGPRQAGWLCGTGCLRIRPNPAAINPRFLFDTLGAPDTAANIANRAKGATMPNLNSTALKSVPVLSPPRRLQDLYVEHVEPIAEQVELLSEQNTRLTAARDLLLPRLMNGEIAV